MRTYDPILDPQLLDQIHSAISMFQRRARWSQWGLSNFRDQGNALLFKGPSGTGKTLTARYIARQLGLQLHEVEMSQLASSVPGELARNLQRQFDLARLPDRNQHESIVFIDECDTLLLSRRNLGRNHMWMLEVINKALTEIRKFPGLVILATNHSEALDEALQGRLLQTFHFAPSKDPQVQLRLWKQKWPRKLPTQPTPAFLQWAISHHLTGNEIENAIIRWASQALYRDEIPQLDNFEINGEVNRSLTQPEASPALGYVVDNLDFESQEAI